MSLPQSLDSSREELDLLISVDLCTPVKAVTWENLLSMPLQITKLCARSFQLL